MTVKTGGPTPTRILDHLGWSKVVQNPLDHPLTSTNTNQNRWSKQHPLDHLTQESYTPSDLHGSLVHGGPYYVGGRHTPPPATPRRTSGAPQHTLQEPSR